MSLYLANKAKAEAARARSTAASAVLNLFPKGSMGLTPDEVKATPEWKAAKREFDNAFTSERAWNTFMVRYFSKEMRAEREAARAAKV